MTNAISNVIDCPQCKLPCNKTVSANKEEVCCEWCGYHHEKTKTGTKSSKGYGSIHYVSDGSNEITLLKSPLSLMEKNDIIYKICHKYNKEKSGLYIWDGKQLECVIGLCPETINNYYDKQYEEEMFQRYGIKYSEYEKYEEEVLL